MVSGAERIGSTGEKCLKREDIFEFVLDNYATKSDYPWADEKYKDAAVLRHKNSRKWYGLIMDVNGKHIGCDDDKKYEILNIKTEPEMIPSLCEQKGIISAYHMNKNHWISIILVEANTDLVFSLLNKSFEMTKTKHDIL